MNAHGLGAFLLDLRQRGLPVGLLEVERIATILAPGPSLSKNELRELFASVILTRPEQTCQGFIDDDTPLGILPGKMPPSYQRGL